MEKVPERLEVPENAEHIKNSRVASLLNPIRRLERPAILETVSQFLPSLQEAQKDLQSRMAAGEDVNVETVGGGGSYVEMEILKAREEGEEEHWTSDSDPDSPPSSDDIQDNDFTSDTDSDSSSSSCNSSSSSSVSSPPRKKPLIQVLPDKQQ